MKKLIGLFVVFFVFITGNVFAQTPSYKRIIKIDIPHSTNYVELVDDRFLDVYNKNGTLIGTGVYDKEKEEIIALEPFQFFVRDVGFHRRDGNQYSAGVYNKKGNKEGFWRYGRIFIYSRNPSSVGTEHTTQDLAATYKDGILDGHYETRDEIGQYTNGEKTGIWRYCEFSDEVTGGDGLWFDTETKHLKKEIDYGGSEQGVHSFRHRGPTGTGDYVFYDKGYYSDGWRYLEVAPEIYHGGSIWSNVARPIGNTEFAIGSGRANTKKIVEQIGHEESAAKKCLEYAPRNYQVTRGEWFLPSKDELNLIHSHHNRTNRVLDFGHRSHWSSSEAIWSSSEDIAIDNDGKYAWEQEFSSMGGRSFFAKNASLSIRCVRAF
jgi:hypothetical protein